MKIMMQFIVVVGFVVLVADPVDACRRCRSRTIADVREQVVIRQRAVAVAPAVQRQVVLPFAVPVGVPVTTSRLGLGYSYREYSVGRGPYSALTPDELADRVAERVVKRFSMVEGLRVAGFAAPPIVQHCAKCHAGPAPRGGVSLSLRFLTPARRYAATRAVMTGRMPQGKTLSSAERSAVIHDLMDLEPAPVVDPETDETVPLTKPEDSE